MASSSAGLPPAVPPSAPPSDGLSSEPFALQPSSKRGSSPGRMVTDYSELPHRLADEALILPGDSVSQVGSRVPGGSTFSGSSRKAWLLNELQKSERLEAEEETQRQYETFTAEQAALAAHEQLLSGQSATLFGALAQDRARA